jgi:pyruvate/2-oxoglutarate/acetoin dehydrogenase E1 component
LFWDLDAPILRITTPHVPLPAADRLEDLTIPSAKRIVASILKTLD